MNDRITALEEALKLAANRLHRCCVDYDTGTRKFIEIGEWADEARAALAASRAAPDCHQPDLVTAAQVRVKPLVWDDFDGMGAKASAFYNANYLITMWRGRGQFEVALSYPGHQTGYDGERFHDTLEAAKAAAQADYEARILAALDLTPAPAVEPVATNIMVQPVATPHECATEGCGKLASVHFIRGDIGSYYCMDCYLRVHKQTHPDIRAIGGDA